MTPSFADIGREKVETGRYINDADYQHNARVCVIGADLVDKLFPNVDPLDKEIQIAGLPFRVIGVTERLGSTFGQSQDNFAHRSAQHLPQSSGWAAPNCWSTSRRRTAATCWNSRTRCAR